MGGILLSDNDETQLYVLLKPREAGLPQTLRDLLRRVERSLYGRMTVEDIERLSARFS